mmetsp:Transcript_73144/g.141488  ORF Transcript_73144/g.141488 Transcript_73144/m.141488 type:complete len:170 (+) Transcript_73144:2-511(+)
MKDEEAGASGIKHEREALGELEDVTRLVREASDQGSDASLTPASPEELVKQLEDLGITLHVEAVQQPTLLGTKGIVQKSQPPVHWPAVQEEPMQISDRKTRQGARGKAKSRQRQKAKADKNYQNVVHVCQETEPWPEKSSIIKIEEKQVLTKPGIWPFSLYSCLTVETF